MLTLGSSMRIYLHAHPTDMRKSFDGLMAIVQGEFGQDVRGGDLFVFINKRADRLKALWWDGDGLCLFAKRLERGRFIWPRAENGKVSLTPAQLSMLLEGIDWRIPKRTAPVIAA